MPLKIAYISDERFPSLHTDTQQVIKNIDALGRVGASVDLIQPRMFRHLGKSRKQVKADICQYYNVEGNFALRDMTIWPASDLRVEKLFHGLAAPFRALMGQYDVVYTRNLIPLRMAVALRLPVLFETYRALPNTNPRSWKTVLGASTAKRFVGITTHSEYSRGVMIDNGVPPDMVRAVPNGFDPSDFANHPDKNTARKQLGWDPDERIAIYTGQVREDKGVHTLLDMAEEYTDFRMVLVGGEKADVEQLVRTATERRLTNVEMVGQQPIAMVPTYLAAADVVILPPSSVPLKSATVLPMKTFTYMAAGRPILAPNLPDTAGVLENGVNSLMVEPDNVTAAVAGLKKLFESDELASTLAARAAEDAQKFTWDGRARNMIAFIEERLSL